MKPWLRFVLGFLILVLSYLVFLPASWLDHALQRWSAGSLGVTGTSGTLWQGQGTLQAILPRGEAVTLAPAAWKVDLGELFKLRLHVTVRSSQNGDVLLDTTLAPGSAWVHEAKLNLPAALLGGLSPTLRAAALSGQLAVQARDLRTGSGHAQGNARVVWTAAGSDISPVHPLGNYQLDLTGQASGVEFQLTTLAGALNLSGSGRIQPGQNPDYRITAIPTAEKRKALAPLLRILGRETAPGTYLLQIDQNVQAVGH